MSVTIKVTPILRQYTGENKSVEVEGNTVLDCLKNLVDRYPGTEKWLFNNSDAPMICLFLNGEIILPKALDTKVSKGDIIDLCPVIGGG
jgi:molybdopterin converting factor small subunit